MLPKPTAPSANIHPKSNKTRWAQMRPWLLALLTFNFSFLTIQCGLDVEDPTPPSPPVWVQKSLPEEWPERGIDAHESGGIFIEWHSNPSDDIIAYHLYRAALNEALDSLGGYELIVRLETSTNTRTEYLDEQAITWVEYFYRLKSEDDSGNLSEYSDSVSYKLMQSITLPTMNPNGHSMILGNERTLSWIYRHGIAMEDYCISVLTQDNQFLYREIFQPTNYLGGVESWDIPAEVELTPGQLYKWRIDMGAKYHNSLETNGSESPWAEFLFSND